MTTLADPQLAAIMLQAGFPRNERVLAEGLATIHAESGGDPKSQVPGNEHIGLWAESSAFGTEAQRLNALQSTKAAFKEWLTDGRSFFQAWGQWEAEQSGRNGALEWRKYVGAARQALRGAGVAPPRAAGASAFRPAATPAASNGPSGGVTFLLTAALVLGGLGLTVLGTMRTAGAVQGAEA